MRVLGALVAALLFSCGESAEHGPFKVVYNRKSLPLGWTPVGRAAPQQRMKITIGLKQQNVDVLEKKFWAISDPSSPEYQNFMSIDEINAVVQPKQQHIEAVENWLKQYMPLNEALNLKKEHRGDAIRLTLPVKVVERMFDTTVYVCAHSKGHSVLRQMGPYSVPEEVKDAIDLIEGLSEFPMPRAKLIDNPRRFKRMTAGQGAAVPQTLDTMYGIPSKPADERLVSQAPAEFQDDTSYSPQDLQYFLTNTGLPQISVDPTHIVGPFNSDEPDVEASLDMQYVVAAGQGANDWYWTTEGWMFEFSSSFFAAKSVPEVVSVSWGWSEAGQCGDVTDSGCNTVGNSAQKYVERVNTEFMKIGARGVSLVVSSGDSGAHGRTDSDCTADTLRPDWPASSPYVTAVGATQLSNAKSNLPSSIAPPVCKDASLGYSCWSGGEEVAVSYDVAGFTSGGGFSVYTPQPAYQKAAVSAYLNDKSVSKPPAKMFNAKGRAYPDIAALGNGYMVYMDSQGGWNLVGGTSASAPTVAGIASHLNDLSMQLVGKPLGFLNGLLYKMFAEHPKAFTDVVSGDNKCTEDGCADGCQGYNAAKGWDPVTGLGTPNTAEMLTYLKALLTKKYNLQTVANEAAEVPMGNLRTA